jgi:hypothetical protein
MDEFEIVSGSVEEFGNKKIFNPDTVEMILPVLIGNTEVLIKVKL